MRLKKLLAMTLAVIVGLIPVSTMAADDSSSISQNKRVVVVVVSKNANKKDTDASLNKYKYKKVKSLTSFKGAEVILVDDTDKIADFSAVGKVAFCSPGIDIRSTYLDNGYANLSSTSMATPHVTGVLALMLADSRNDADGNDNVSTKEVKNIILSCAEDIGTVEPDEIYGNGILKTGY